MNLQDTITFPSKNVLEKIKTNRHQLKTQLEAVDFCREAFYANNWTSFSYTLTLYKNKIKTLNDLENLRKTLCKKIENIDALLLKPNFTKKLSSSVNLKILNNCKPFEIDGIKIGRCAKGSSELFKTTQKNKHCIYYHSQVDGGSLVVAQKESIEAASCALVYSKNLKKTGQINGSVVSSNDVTAMYKDGSFNFRNRKTVYTECAPIYLKIDMQTKSAQVTFKDGSYILTPFEHSEFKENFTKETISKLQQLIPPYYGWRSV